MSVIFGRLPPWQTRKVTTTQKKVVAAPANDPTSVNNHNIASWKPPVDSLDIVREIADVMQQPPRSFSVNYINSCVHAAAYLNNPVPKPSKIKQKTNKIPTGINDINVWTSVIFPKAYVDDEYDYSSCQQARSHVLAVIERVTDFATKAANVGFLPPSNPFTRIAMFNSWKRGTSFKPLDISKNDADDILFNIKAYVDLLQAYDSGAINLSSGIIDAAQLSHVSLSFNGFGGSGNATADILKFLPSLDDIKKEQADQALSVLDFRKRIPHLLFTLDYTPEQGKPSHGTIVAWKKIADASGYVLKRHAVFGVSDSENVISNEEVNEKSSALMSYAKTYALSFLQDVDPKMVMMWLDDNAQSDEMFMYKVCAYQIKTQVQGSVFTIDSRPVSLTQLSKTVIKNQIIALDKLGSVRIDGDETISPWPMYAQQILGDSSYDWLLSAVNVRASINRGDTKDVTRNYSYLNAKSAFLNLQADAGKLVKPADVNDIVKNIAAGIQKYGVTQIIQELLDETGVTYYFEGRDPYQNTLYARAGTLNSQDSGLFKTIANAIDPETATLDIKSLATNMAALLNSSQLNTDTQLLPGDGHANNSNPKEISVPNPEEMNDKMSEGPLQYINKMGSMKDSVVDLTTFEGLSTFMRTLRIMSDFGPNRLPTNVSL